MSQQEYERVVSLGEIPREVASKAISDLHKDGIKGIEGLSQAAIQFTEVPHFTTFKAQFAVKDEDLIFQFFLTSEQDKEPKDGPIAAYWMSSFPAVLDTVAQYYFKAVAPRLQAKYTEELQSWWLRAQGFGGNLDPARLADKFLEELDAALDKAQALNG